MCVLPKVLYANPARVRGICIQRAHSKYRIINTALHSIAETLLVTRGKNQHPSAVKHLNGNQAQSCLVA